MDSNKLNKKKISRKGFLQMAGSVIAGGTIIGTTGYLIGNRSNQLKNNGENHLLQKRCHIQRTISITL